MANLLPIQSVHSEDIYNVITKAILADLDIDLIEDFVASVDWSGSRDNLGQIAELLGSLEGWTTLFAEGQMNEQEYVDHLTQLLPPEWPSRDESKLTKAS